MGVGTPDTTQQVEDRIKADVAREAPDSNPFLRVHWLRSVLTGFARRIFDFYGDLERTEERLFPDTTDNDTAERWGNIYVGPKNASTMSSGGAVATGVAGGVVGVGATLTANGVEYTTISSATIADQVISVLSITRTGQTATVITTGNHNLSSRVPVTIAGAGEIEYNVTDTEIVVTDLDTFTYTVVGSPVSPATGTITAAFTSANVTIESVSFGSITNLDADTPLQLETPIIDVDDTLSVDFGAIGGGTGTETLPDYRERYLDKIRNPVAHYNAADITATAKEVSGVTRVFVEEAGDVIGTVAVSTLTRVGNVATVVTATDHGFDDGQNTSILGADQFEYNVTNARIIVEDLTTFHYIVFGSPTTPATGTITADVSVPLGQSRTFFMRDNDDNPIPTASEVQTVKDKIDNEIRPANTSILNNIVKAPLAVVTDYIFTELVPNTTSMKDAVNENLVQFYAEQTFIAVSVDEDAYRAAIFNTVDPVTGDIVSSFDLSAPIGDIVVGSGEIATKGSVTIP